MLREYFFEGNNLSWSLKDGRYRYMEKERKAVPLHGGGTLRAREKKECECMACTESLVKTLFPPPFFVV